jgi:hypothetical protein
MTPQQGRILAAAAVAINDRNLHGIEMGAGCVHGGMRRGARVMRRWEQQEHDADGGGTCGIADAECRAGAHVNTERIDNRRRRSADHDRPARR